MDVYCPWDVMNYVLDLQRKPDAKPLSYWKNTSDNAIIRSFIDYAGSSITQKLETLLSGGYIVQQVDENLTYDYLHSSEENLWSILYLTGYLTSVRADNLENPLPGRFTALTIPNEEIREIYETTVIRWFDESAPKWNRSALFDAVWKGNIQELQGELNRDSYAELSVIMITGRIFTMHFWQVFLPEQAIWWSQIRSMAMAEVMWW